MKFKMCVTSLWGEKMIHSCDQIHVARFFVQRTEAMDIDLCERIEKAGYLCESACSSDIVSLYPVENVIWRSKTAYSDAIIADVRGYGRMLFLDNEAQSAASDECIYHECLVHPVMASVPSGDRSKVLVIGGGEGATAREVLKWSDVRHVDWVDIDGELVSACRDHLGWAPTVYDDPRLNFYAEDIMAYLRRSARESYNVIIIDLPDPEEEENGLYTTEFWSAVKAHLHEGGAIVTHCGPSRFPDPQRMIRWVQKNGDIPAGGEYHANIPSFTDDWGFVMSCRPVFSSPIPQPVRFLTPEAYKYIFMWPGRM
jgi:spermidine synthase